MSALALICALQGARVLGSDRAYDRGQSADKFQSLAAQGIELVAQDGSGVCEALDALVVSTAIEDSIPDIAAAKARGVQIITRAQLLAGMFNASECGISIAGTSGKSTVTGMVAHVLSALSIDPTVMNGAVIKSLGSNMRVSTSKRNGPFVTETDESDGSIALYNPSVGVLNNIAIDHMPMEELERLFGDFISRAKTAAVLNFDDLRVKALAVRAQVPVFSYTLADAKDVVLRPDGAHFSYEGHEIKLKVPGAHNISNALACLSVCRAMDIELRAACRALSGFTGIKRRMDMIGTKNDITVIDDFGHNPDKIAASLRTLKAFDGRLIIMFQPHGFGPLRLMGKDIAAVFTELLGDEDMLIMPDPYYAGGTADRSVTGKDVINWVTEKGGKAHWIEERSEMLAFITQQAGSGDCIVIMGARDDTLSDFAAQILAQL